MSEQVNDASIIQHLDEWKNYAQTLELNIKLEMDPKIQDYFKERLKSVNSLIQRYS